MKKHMDDMLKNECFLDKESSIYAGLMLGAIYSTLLENDIKIYHMGRRMPQDR